MPKLFLCRMGMYSGVFVVVFGVESRLSEVWKRRKKKKTRMLIDKDVCG